MQEESEGVGLVCLPTQLKLDHSQSVLLPEDFSPTCVCVYNYEWSVSVYNIIIHNVITAQQLLCV